MVILIIVAAAVGARFFSGENAWVCEDGKWLKHGNPTAPMPDGGCEGISGDPVGMKPHYSSDIQQKYATEEKIKVISLKSGDAIESPVEIEGEARGIWYFEGSFPIIIEDEKGKFFTINEWESQFWKHEIEPGVYNSPIDTTFHLFVPQYYLPGTPLITGLRVSGNGRTVLHLPWHKSFLVPEEEREFYYKSTKHSRSLPAILRSLKK